MGLWGRMPSVPSAMGWGWLQDPGFIQEKEVLLLTIRLAEETLLCRLVLVYLVFEMKMGHSVGRSSEKKLKTRSYDVLRSNWHRVQRFVAVMWKAVRSMKK